MWREEYKLFDRVEAACGNRYLAVRYIAKLSRELGHKAPPGILGSNLITWALTGKRPEIKYDFDNFMKLNPDIAIMEDFLQYVQDESVRISVRKSYVASVQQNHLVYVYNDDLDQFKQTRVRVLLRMIWSEHIVDLFNEGGL